MERFKFLKTVASVAGVSALLLSTAPVSADESGLSISAFADAYYAVTSQDNADALSDAAGNHRSYVFANGFGLSFAGIDATLEGDGYGATISTRMGPSVIQYFGDNSASGFANLTQAYGTWAPSDDLTLDLGMFGTIYGAEVAESWQNMNYTRGALYFAMQPFWHTGLRGSYQLSDSLGLTALVVNGSNNIFETTGSLPSLGLQAALSLGSAEIYLGWLGAFGEDDVAEEGGLADQFVDLVVSAGFGDLSVLLNADLGLQTDAETSYYGASLALGYPFTNWASVAVRGEYLAYPDGEAVDFGAVDGDGAAIGAAYENLMTGTLTLDFKPVPNQDNVIIRGDLRYEVAGNDAFADADSEPTTGWYTAVLGAVVTTN